MSQRRIAALTLSFKEPRLMLAGVKDGMVHIIESKKLERSLPALQKTLPAQLDKLRQRGFVLLVDEVVPHFARYGRAVRLSDDDGTGRPIIVSAMQSYLNLSKYQALSFPVGAGGLFDVSPSIVDEVRGGDGKPAYKIDWPELKPDNVAMLMCVYAATQDNIFDGTVMADLMKGVGARKRAPSIRDPFNNIIEHFNKNRLSVDGLNRRDD